MIEQTHGGSALPTTVGIGLRLQHFSEIRATRPAIAWLEVHPENYFVGGVGPTRLDVARRDYALSLHGVGLSLGTAEGIDGEHLRRLKGADRAHRVIPCL